MVVSLPKVLPLRSFGIVESVLSESFAPIRRP
jgi:hypothetical protein